MDQRGNIKWEKWLTEVPEYSKSPTGVYRHIHNYKDDIDYRFMDFTTLEQTTHVNCAVQKERESTKILATLFHQGHIIELDVASEEVKLIRDGLSRPHSVEYLGISPKFSYIVCNTSDNEVVFFDKDMNKTRAIGSNLGNGPKFSWVQDAIYTSRGTLLIADADNHRIVETDLKGREISTYKFNPNYRIFKIWEIK